MKIGKHTIEVVRLTADTAHLATCQLTTKALLPVKGTVIVVKDEERPGAVGLLTTIETLGGMVFEGTVFRIVGA